MTKRLRFNGVNSITMNVRSNQFGYLLPLAWGTNTVVVMGSNAGTHVSSNIFTLVRGDSYRLAVTSPAPFGTYANGQAQTVSGYVSAYRDAGLPTQTNVVSVTVNGVGTTLGGIDGNTNQSFTTTNAVPVNADGSATVLNVVVTWADGTSDPPDALLECYNITAVNLEWDFDLTGSATPCISLPAFWHDTSTLTYSFVGSPDGGTNEIQLERDVSQVIDCSGGTTTDEDDTTNADWSPQPSSLDFGLKYGNDDTSTYTWSSTGSGSVDAPDTYDGQLTFLAPWYSAGSALVLMTFQASYTTLDAIDMSQVTYNGQSPVQWSNGPDFPTVSYIVTLNSQEPYTISCGSFSWPAGYSTSVGYTDDHGNNNIVTSSGDEFSINEYGYQVINMDVSPTNFMACNTGATALHILGGLIISAPPGLNAGGAAALFSTNSSLVVDGLLGGELLDNGTIVVVNGSLVTTNCTLGIGSHERAISPAVGLLTVSNSIVEARDVSIGGDTETYGMLEVVGGTMTLSSSLMIGTGNNSDGSVLVADGALLVVTNGATELGGDESGGTLVVSNASFLGNGIAVAADVFSSGEMTINNGTVSLGGLTIGAASLASGNVSLNGGALTVGGVQIPVYQSNGDLSIADGTFTCQSVTIGFAMFSNGSLGIDGGTAIISSNLDIGGDTDNAHLSISGGQLFLTNATMLVDGGPTNSSEQAQCTIVGGEVAAQSIVLGQFLTGNLSLTGGSLTVSAGITMGDCSGQAFGFLTQSGGQLIVTNSSRTAFIDVQNGQLSISSGTAQVDTLVMTNSCSSLIHTGGTLIVGNVILDPNAFRVVSVTRQSNDVLVSWLMAPGATNALQVSTASSYSSNTFTDIFIVTNNTSTGVLTNFLDLGAATNKSRYYRARLSL